MSQHEARIDHSEIEIRRVCSSTSVVTALLHAPEMAQQLRPRRSFYVVLCLWTLLSSRKQARARMDLFNLLPDVVC